MSDQFPFDALGSDGPRLMGGVVSLDREARTASPAGDTAASGHRAPSGRPAPAADDEIHLLDYVKVLYHRRWIASAAFLIVFVSGLVYTFTATPIFESRVELLIEAENRNVVSFKEVIEQDKATNDYYQTQYRILQSRSLARRTLDKLKMWNDPYFDQTNAPRRVSLTGMIAMPVAYVWSFVKPAKQIEPRSLDETATQSRIIDRFLTDLTISPIRNSRLVEVKYQSPDPDLAARIANALSQAYIEQSLEFKYTASKEASDWLGLRLTEQRRQVETSEQALQKYREQTDSVSLDEKQNIVVQKLADLNAAVTRAKTERIQKEAAYNQIKALQGDRNNSIDTFPAILTNTFIQQQKAEVAELQRQQSQLSEKLGPRHPDMLKISNAIATAELKLQGEIAKVVQSVKNEYQSALVQEQNLMTALDQQKHDALALNRKGIDYGALQRDAATNRQIFESLLQRTKETGISGDLRTSNIRIVDAAEVPRTPASPNKPINVLLSLFGGSIFAVGLAFFFEYLDNRIKSPAEIKTELGLAFLGIIPSVGEKGDATPLLNKGVSANFAEAFRGVRTNVLFSAVEEGGRSLAITSTAPGEGKTLVASNLALALAQAGQRVILVDADMRRPRVHEVLGELQEPGLSNVLVGEAKASEAVRQTGIQGLWVLPAGHMPPNPAELLGSKRFKDFVSVLKEHFDWVLIDTPPVMAVTDAPIVAHIVGSVVFVVGAQMTNRSVARTAVEQLANANARVIGAVLNRVDIEHNAYYYSQYYRRDYGDYYTKTA